MRSNLRIVFFSSTFLSLIGILIGYFPSICIMLADQSSPWAARKLYEIGWLVAFTEAQKQTLLYDTARLDYQEKHIAESIKSNSGITLPSLRFFAAHNLGNSYYRLGQTKQNPHDMASQWEKSLIAYSGALQIQSDPETQANYDFVAEKLKKLKEAETHPEKQQKQEQNKQNGAESQNPKKSWTGSQNNTKSWNQKQDAQQDPSKGWKDTWSWATSQSGAIGGTWKNAGEMKNLGTSASGSALSEADKKELEQYLKDLKSTESTDRKYFRLSPPSSTSDSISDRIRNTFGDDPFFTDRIGTPEKDW